MTAILVHGLLRTPASLVVLAARLRAQRLRVSFFAYSATFERFESCVARLVGHVRQRAGDEPYVLVGHSLGTVLIRAALPALDAHPPAACFFLAPPATVCRAATFFAGRRLYRLLAGEMGRLLADAHVHGRAADAGGTDEKLRGHGGSPGTMVAVRPSSQTMGFWPCRRPR